MEKCQILFFTPDWMLKRNPSIQAFRQKDTDFYDGDMRFNFICTPLRFEMIEQADRTEDLFSIPPASLL